MSGDGPSGPGVSQRFRGRAATKQAILVWDIAYISTLHPTRTDNG